jgi:hypothetical protein
MSLKQAWEAWRSSPGMDKDIQKAFERACTPAACCLLLEQLEHLNSWIEVDGIGNMPAGNWLVYMPGHVHPVQAANVHRNISTIGSHFDFDMPKVTAYKKLPEAP